MEQNVTEFRGTETVNDLCYFFPSADESELSTTRPGPGAAPAGADDPAAAADRRAKKKIQNRIAQRTYRSRVKQRLEYLQRQVESLQTEARQLNGQNPNADGQGPSPPSSIAEIHDTIIAVSHDPARVPETSKPVCNANNQRQQQQQQRQRQQQVQPQPPPQPQPPQHSPSHDASAAPQQLLDWSPTHQRKASSSSWASGRQHLTGPIDHSHGVFATMMPSPETNDSRFMGTQPMQLDPQLASHHLFFPYQDPFPDMQANSDPKQMMGSGLHDIQDTIIFPPTPQSTIRGSWPAPTQVESLPPAASAESQPTKVRTERSQGQPDTSMESQAGAEPAIPNRDSPLHTRFEYVLECAKAVGFESFDALVSVYYTANFEDSSSLSSEQRLSRMRRLPGLIAALRDTSAGWTQWERQGYQDEILKSAESILGTEYNRFTQNSALKDEIVRLYQASEGGDDQSTHAVSSEHEDKYSTSGINEAVNKIQDQLPNLWAFIMALTMENRSVRPKDRSHMAFMSLLIMCCSGNCISKSQMGAWMSS